MTLGNRIDVNEPIPEMIIRLKSEHKKFDSWLCLCCSLPLTLICKWNTFLPVSFDIGIINQNEKSIILIMT
jgi:hypothetical protein